MRQSGTQSGDHPGSCVTRARRALVALALASLFAVLLLPAHPRDLVPASFLRLPLELPLTVLALLVLRDAPSRLFRVLVVTVVGALLLLRLADLGSRLAFDRDFSPLLELHLLGDGWNLASASVGRLSDDPALLERLPRALWSDGMLPADDLPSQPMGAMRGMLARRFGAGSPDTGAAVRIRP